MKKISSFGLMLFFVTACSDTPPSSSTAPENNLQRAVAPQPIQVLRGMYAAGPQGNSFYTCSDGKMYRVNGQPASLDSLYESARGPAPYDGESVYAVVEGRFGTSDNTLTISRVDSMAGHSVFNTCLPFDFWCTGTEPFWRLLISEQEAGFGFKLIGEDRGQIFPWRAAKTDGRTWTYESSDPATGQKLKVVVRKTACSDGMSDRRFNYAAEINLGAYTLRGCAVRYGETVVARGE